MDVLWLPEECEGKTKAGREVKHPGMFCNLNLGQLIEGKIRGRVLNLSPRFLLPTFTLIVAPLDPGHVVNAERRGALPFYCFE